MVLEGTNAVPEAEVSSGLQGLSVAASTTELTAQAPEEQAAPDAEGETAQQQEPIELIVTPTRTERRRENVPRSVTVITREQIEEQTSVSRDISEILGQLVPGLGPPTQSLSNFGQILRGRPISVLIDGIPQSTNRNVFRNLQTIDPSAIERIEVLRGPTANFGSEATGGVINIITRKPQKGEFSATTQISTDLSLTHPDESLGITTQQQFTGRVGKIDYTLNAAFDSRGGFFDAEGDRIPPNPNTQGGISDSNTFNVLSKFGFNFNEDQRLEFTFSRFDLEQDTEFKTDPSTTEIPGRQKARVIEEIGRAHV